jgi:MerR family transcriptional regulator, light-induced transcriptional regulator
MTALDETPTFNLKVVVQETGLKPDTLRAWERRYGLPKPGRTSGGHRLYSQGDIDTLNWLVARQEEGLSISRAVDLWERFIEESQDPLAEMPLSQQADKATQPVLDLGHTGGALADLRAEWVAACMSFDERRAEHVMAQAFALYPVEAVCGELLQKGIAEIGAGWYAGNVTVQQEHFASALAMRRLEALLSAAPVPTRPGRILAGCPAEEQHVFSLLMLTLTLRRQGWEVIYLGANVPLARLQATIASARPNLIVSSAQQLFTAATLLEMAQLVYNERIPFAFGGMVFNRTPELAERIPGHFLGREMNRVSDTVEQLLHTPRLNATAMAVTAESLAARDHYRENQALIEAYVWQKMRGIAHDHLINANANMGRNIIAALSLGDIAYAGNDMAWLQGLLVNHNLPLEMLDGYLAVYLESLKKQLDERGRPIIEWLSQLVV